MSFISVMQMKANEEPTFRNWWEATDALHHADVHYLLKQASFSWLLAFSSPMRSSKHAKDDLKVLQNEYKHMQVNRNAFANESELVSSWNKGSFSSNQNSSSHQHILPYIHHRSYGNNKQLSTSWEPKMRLSRQMWRDYKHAPWRVQSTRSSSLSWIGYTKN